MDIIENDGSYITVQLLDSKWPVAEVLQRHHDRVAEAIVAAGFVESLGSDDWVEVELDRRISGEEGTYRRLRPEVARLFGTLPAEVRERVARENAGDYREAIGRDRTDAKVLVRSTKKRTYEEWADEFGIPTNDLSVGGWRPLVVTAVREAPTRGQVGD